MKDLRDEILHHALELKLKSLKEFRNKSLQMDQKKYFEDSIQECQQMIIELRLNGSITI